MANDTTTETPTSTPWTCSCGRIVHGNGGKSSHQRTCLTFQVTQRDSWARNLTNFKAERRPRHEINNAQRMLNEHQEALNAIVANQGDSLTAEERAHALDLTKGQTAT